jgi:small subunit ribosomal protein S8
MQQTQKKNLLYEDGASRIHGMERISKTSKRMYIKSKDIKRTKGGLGSTVISTPKGIMTDKEARKANLGGEELLRVW